MSLVFFWLSSFLQAALFWFVSIFISKQFGVDSLGEFSYALALVSPLVILSGLQLRNYCLTQKKPELFEIAKTLRLSLTIVSLLSLVIWSALFSPQFLGVIFLVGLLKFSELWSDLCFGWMQFQDRLASVALFQTLKYGGLIVLLIVLFVAPTQMSFIFFLGVLSSFLIFSAWIDHRASRLHHLALNWNWDKAMVKTTFYLSVASFLTSFSINIPRYFLEHFQDLTQVALFSGLFYFYLIPHLGFNYLNIAFLKKMSHSLSVAIFLKISFLLLALSSLCFVGLHFFGPELMRLLYSIDVEWSVQHSLLISYLVFISGVLSFLYYYLLSAQIYEVQIKANIGALLITLLSSWYLIPEHGVIGGLTSLSLANSFLALIYLLRFFSHKNVIV